MNRASWWAMFMIAAGACSMADRTPDPAAQQRADSLRAVANARSTARRWSDAQLAAFVRSTASTLMQDNAVVDELGRHQAVRVFAARMRRQQLGLAREADSLVRARFRTPSRSPDMTLVLRHTDELHTLTRNRDNAFDMAYVSIAVRSLGAILTRLEGAGEVSREPEFEQLLTRSQTLTRGHLATAIQLQRMLQATHVAAP